MAEPIDCFSSTPPPAHGERPPGSLEEDYNLVFDGLRISTEAATTVFARAVKFDIVHRFQELDIRVVREMPTTVEPLLPCWVHQSSVTVLVSDSQRSWNKVLLQELASEIVASIVRAMAVRTSRTSESLKVHLIGPVHTDIKEIRNNLFSFFVKQKWALTPHER
jgi:hypothetical protein